MTDIGDAVLVTAQLHATWSMLIEKGVLVPPDIQTIKRAALDRARHRVSAGSDLALPEIVDNSIDMMRGARRG